MKKIINIAGLFLFAILAGYSAYWYVLANQAEKAFKANLEAWKTENKIDTISYDSIAKEGFPTHINLRLENPKFVSINSNMHEKIEGDLKGFLTLSVPMIRNEREIGIDGKAAFKITNSLENDPKTTQLSWNGQSLLAFADSELTHFDILTTLFLRRDASQNSPLQPSFQTLKIDAADYSLSWNDQNKTPKLEGGPLKVKFSKKFPREHQEDLLFSISTHDLVFNGITSESPWIPFEDYGKISFDLDGSFCYPPLGEWEAIAADLNSPRQLELCLKIDRFQFNSDLMNVSKSNLILSLQQDGLKWNFIQKFFAEKNYSEKYDKVVQNYFAGLLKNPEFIEKYATGDEEKRKSIQAHESEIVSLLPVLHPRGNMSLKFDLNATSLLEDTQFNLNTVELRFPPFMISLNGKANFKDYYNQPTAQAVLKISQYKLLVEQLAKYANQIPDVYNKIASKPVNIAPIHSPEHIKGIVAFLHDLSDDPKKEGSDLKVTFVFSEENGWKIGSMTYDELMVKLADLFMIFNPLPPLDGEVNMH